MKVVDRIMGLGQSSYRSFLRKDEAVLRDSFFLELTPSLPTNFPGRVVFFSKFPVNLIFPTSGTDVGFIPGKKIPIYRFCDGDLATEIL